MGDEHAAWFFTLGNTLNELAMDDSPDAEPLFAGRVEEADVNYRRALGTCINHGGRTDG